MKSCECQALNQDDAVFCDTCGRRFPAIDNSDAARSRNASTEVTNATTYPQRRLLVIVAGFIAIVLVVAVVLTVLLRNVHIEISSNNLVSVQLPLEVCKTTVGVQSETPANLPATLNVEITKGYSTNLAFYSDDEGLTEILAPSGWICTAAIGANGSSSVHVSPPGQTDVSNAALSAGSRTEEISASQTSACVGCREAVACPLFVSAANDYRSAYQLACPTTRPSSEVVTKNSSHLIEFTDPPGTSGDATPSGGAYPAMGVMTYFDDFKSDGSWTETCVLPAMEKSMCKVILGNFVARYEKR